jgi:hypothetical protein
MTDIKIGQEVVITHFSSWGVLRRGSVLSIFKEDENNFLGDKTLVFDTYGRKINDAKKAIENLAAV